MGHACTVAAEILVMGGRVCALNSFIRAVQASRMGGDQSGGGGHLSAESFEMSAAVERERGGRRSLVTERPNDRYKRAADELRNRGAQRSHE